MGKVLLIWTESNPSTMEKEFLMLNGLEKSGIKAYAMGFSHSRSNRLYFEQVYAKDALYTFSFGNERSLYQGRNYLEKVYSNLYLVVWFSTSLYKLLRKRVNSIMIIPTNPPEITIPALLLGKLFGVRVVPNIMEYEPSLPSFRKNRHFLHRWSWGLVTKYSDAYIVISDFLGEKMRGISIKPVFCLPAILPPRDACQKNDFVGDYAVTSEAGSGEVPVLIFTSSPQYEDLLAFCLDALSQLRNRDFHLLVTGEYPREKLKVWMEKVSNLGLHGKVDFTGFLSAAEMHKLQVRSWALLMPLLDNERHRARFPQKILGYMGLGKPVISTKVGAVAENFNDDVMIMDVSGTVSGYAEKIRFLLDHPNQAAGIGNRGSRYVESKFNESILGKQLASFLISLGT
jgi:glycosyltransferase involved in cell wall biosynthesis